MTNGHGCNGVILTSHGYHGNQDCRAGLTLICWCGRDLFEGTDTVFHHFRVQSTSLSLNTAYDNGHYDLASSDLQSGDARSTTSFQIYILVPEW